MLLKALAPRVYCTDVMRRVCLKSDRYDGGYIPQADGGGSALWLTVTNRSP